MLVAVIVLGGFIGAVLFMGRESMSSTCGRFLSALSSGDIDTLVATSYAGTKTPEEMRKEWEFTINEAAPYYRFIYKIENSREQGSTGGSVAIRFWKNATSSGSYDEQFDIPMVKTDGGWKVDVRGISREMFPALPR